MHSRLVLFNSLVATFLPAFSFGADSAPVRFDRDIRPILSDNCFHCHGPDDGHREADLRLDLKEHAFSDETGITAFKPGKLDESEAWLRIISDDPDLRMPPAESNKELTLQQIALFKRWIEQGAQWTNHWSFVPPKRSPVPMVSGTKQLDHPIDQFIRARLEQEELKPAPEANRRTLIRCLSFDLTGLPPKPQDVEQFVNDKSPDAYEKLVDRLLDSPHYGERMALMWLDLARYGDTSVFHADGPRNMWAWRDHLVKAYNDNQPFDQFSTEQLAGDLLPGATVWQKVASGFNRNNGTTDEGGLIEEEYRVEYAVDRVKTTSMVWLGLSMECAQCHEHKYDPISQEDYYKFFAFFNISADRGKQTRNGNAAPTVNVPDPDRERKLPEVRKQLAQQNERVASRSNAAEPAFQAWLKKKAAKARTDSLDLIPSGAILHFRLTEGHGNSVTDSLDSKRKGSVKGKVEWVKSKFDQGLKFNGSNYVDLGDLADFERTDSFSYGGWINVAPKAGGALLAKMDDGNSYRGYDLLISGGHVEVHIINNWPDNAIKVWTKKAIAPNEWHHVFATYDGSSKAAGVTIYVDGKPWEWDIQQNGLTATIRTQKTLLIGSRHPGSRLRGSVDEVRAFKRKLTAAEVQALAHTNPLAPLLAVRPDQRTKEQTQTLRDYYLNNVDEQYSKLREQRDRLKAQEAELQKPMTTVMIMQDMSKPRDTFVLNRGSYDQPTERKVEPGVPAILPPLTEDMPQNRLGLAKWLFQESHPLTARVAVNRYWQMLFGRGLVSTPGDFGSQGEYPSHPELLDWLAVDFRESGWNVKRMIKQIVMSATYRQSSLVSPQLGERDPDNCLLARGPRFRLQGEFIRDNALAVSGLLVSKMGGPGVKPYQPPGLWTQVGLGGNPKFVQDHGDQLYRRSLYTYWKRSAPPPSMQIFDAPTREKCIVQRPRTNTPLQALVTLNDVQFVEAARNLAQRMMTEAGESPGERLSYAYMLALARKPRASEQHVMLDVYEASLQQYRDDTEAAKKLLSFGESKRDESLEVAEHAAWTVIASMILNFDETLTRG